MAVLANEVRVLQELEAKGFIWAPKHCVSDIRCTNPACYPFVALIWIPGTPLPWTATCPLRIYRDTILGQMARIQASLIECTQEKLECTAVKFFTRLIDYKLRRIRTGTLCDLSEQDCFDRISMAF
ncbi:hypothetical protein PSPO01_15661 [Paraphaeosphaeria sporulosa]